MSYVEEYEEGFLQEVIAFLEPKIKEDIRNRFLSLLLQWIHSELLEFCVIYDCFEIEATAEINNVKANFALIDNNHAFSEQRYLLTINVYLKDNHQCNKEMRFLFVGHKNDNDIEDMLILEKDNSFKVFSDVRPLH